MHGSVHGSVQPIRYTISECNARTRLNVVYSDTVVFAHRDDKVILLASVYVCFLGASDESSLMLCNIC